MKFDLMSIINAFVAGLCCCSAFYSCKKKRNEFIGFMLANIAMIVIRGIEG